MNVKNFVAGGIVGGIVHFLLGWLLWGILFKDFFPQNEMNMLFVFLGCMTFGFLLSFVFTRWANISTAVGGAKGGAILALFLGLYDNFFRHSSQSEIPTTQIAVDLGLMLVCGLIVGAVIGFVNGKLK